MTSIRRCEIVSNLIDESNNTLFDMDNMKEIIHTKNCIKDYSYIVHDKDIYDELDEKKNPNHKCGTLKTPHVHLLLRFESEQPQQLEYVAKWFGIAPNFINKIKGRWEDACLYQVHLNAPDKFQYDIEDVVCNFNYQKLVERAEKKKSINKIIKRILDGEIREYNKTLEIDHMTLVTNSKIINDAFRVRSEYLQAIKKDRSLECIFITGTSSSGKTTLAKKIAREKELAFFVSSSSNDILYGYKQEPCVILDDIRPSCLELSNFLKMLDSNTHSTVKSRYHNKFLDCELIILTSVLDIDTFYSNVFSNDDEPITQLKRRCKTYIHMDRKNISICVWDNKNLRYSKPIIYKNTLLDEYIPDTSISNSDVEKHVANLIPFLELQEDSVFEDMQHNEQLKIPFT